MDNYISIKFRWLTFWATWGVVISHSHTLSWNPGVITCASRLQSHIVDLMWWPVPLFFVMSGFLFCSSYEKYGWKNFLVKKFHSLYIPALIWIFIGEMLILPILFYLNTLPSYKSILGAFVLAIDQRVWPNGEAMYGGQFWYIRDLLLFFIFSPILYWLGRLKWISVLGSVFVFILFFFIWPQPRIVWIYDFGFLLHDLVFITIGMAVYQSGVWKKRFDNGFGIVLLAIFLVVFILGECFLGRGSDLWWMFNRAIPVAIIWIFYDIIYPYVGGNEFPKYLLGSFFVYCLHEAVIKYISGVFKVFFGVDDWVRNLVFTINAFSFWICLAIFRIIGRYFPKILMILVGGRL